MRVAISTKQRRRALAYNWMAAKARGKLQSPRTYPVGFLACEKLRGLQALDTLLGSHRRVRAKYSMILTGHCALCHNLEPYRKFQNLATEKAGRSDIELGEVRISNIDLNSQAIM